MKQRIKRVKELLKRAEKMNLNIDKLTEGKPVETLARNKTTLQNFEKRYERQKQLPKLKEEVKKIDIKIQERKQKREIEKLRKQKREYISKGTKNIAKYNLKIKEEQLKKPSLRKKTKSESKEFLNRYFKQIKHHHGVERKINKLSKRFGLRLDLFYDFVNYITDLSFKYELPREIMKEETPEDFAEMLMERLDEFERILGREFKI